MKVAYLLPGYVRDTNNFNEIKKFLELNSNHQIDLYTNTYDVLGSPYKEPPTGYLNSDKIDKNYLQSFIDFKSINIENYDQVNDEISKVAEKYSHFIKESKKLNDFRTRKMGCVENGKTILRSWYGQLRNIRKTFLMVEDIESYDLIIKSRFDAQVSKLDLNDYEKLVKPGTIFGVNSVGRDGKGSYSDCGGVDPSKSSIRLDNGFVLKTFVEVVIFGDPIAMKAWCDIDEERFGRICSDDRLSSEEYKKYDKIRDIKHNIEFFLSFNYFVLNNMKNYERMKPLPGHLGIVPRKAWKNEN